MTPDADDLREVVEAIDGDVDSIAYADGRGHFVTEEEFGEDEEDALNDAGFVIVGGIDIPGMRQVNVEARGTDE